MEGATPIESISLQFYEDSESAIKGIEKVIKSFQKLKAEVSNITLNIKGVKNIQELATATEGISESSVSKLERLGAALQVLSSVSIPSSLASDVKKISKAIDLTSIGGTKEVLDLPYEIEPPDEMVEVQTAINGITDSLDNVEKAGEKTIVQTSFDNLTGSADEAKKKIDGVTDAIEGVQQATAQKVTKTFTYSDYATALNGGKTTKLTTSDAEMDATAQAIRRLRGEARLVVTDIKDAGTTVTETNSKFKLFRSGVDSLFTSFKNIGSSLVRKGLGAVGGGIKNLWDRTLGAHSAFFKLFNSIKRVATYRLIRTAIKGITQGVKTGIDNLYQWSAAFDSLREFANSMDRIATAALYVKNSLGAMAAPLINALAPALDYLADKFVMLLNVINEFFAALTGASTYTVARKVAQEYKDAAADASGAAKALKSFTIGIDELNIIEDTGRSGGGGGADNNVAEDWFHKETVDTQIANFWGMVREAFENGDWATLGITLGDGFNRLVDNVDWEGIGTNAGQKFTGAVTTAYWTLKTADFTNVGESFAETVNAFLENADFETAGRTITAFFTNIGDAITGFLDETDWGLFSTKVKDLLLGTIKEFNEWAEGKDWAKISEDVSGAIRQIIDAFTGEDVTSELGGLLKNGAEIVWNLTIKVAWDLGAGWGTDAGNYMYDLIHGNADETLVGAMGANIIELSMPQFSWAQDDDTISGFVDLFDKLITGDEPALSEVIKSSLMRVIPEGIRNAINDLTNIVDIGSALYKLFNLGNGKQGNLYGKKSISSSFATIGDAIYKQLTKPFEGLVRVVNIVIDAIKKLKAALTTGDWGEVKTFISNGIGGITGEIKKRWESDEGDLISTIVKIGVEAGNRFFMVGKNALTAGEDAVRKFGQGMSSNMSSVKSAANNIKATALSQFSNIKAEFKTSGENIVAGIQAGLTSKQGALFNQLKKLAEDSKKGFNNAIKSHSPAKLFVPSGENIVLGVNKGISDNAYTTTGVINDWVDSFSTIPMNVGLSDISMPDLTDVVDKVQQYVATSSTVAVDGSTGDIEAYLTNSVLPLLTGIADNTRRQADKNETTEVVLDSRKVTQSVNRQNRNNGYSFT